MDAAAAAAMSLHHHPLPASLPPSHHHNHCRTLPLPIPIPHHTNSYKRPPPPVSSAAARPANLTALPARSAYAVPATSAPRCSSRATTGYAAALADACVRAGTLRRAVRDARALLSASSSSSSEAEDSAGKKLDARVAALVRMLARKGRGGMVAEVMAEFAAICDHLLPRPARAHC